MRVFVSVRVAFFACYVVVRAYASTYVALFERLFFRQSARRIVAEADSDEWPLSATKRKILFFPSLSPSVQVAFLLRWACLCCFSTMCYVLCALHARLAKDFVKKGQGRQPVNKRLARSRVELQCWLQEK